MQHQRCSHDRQGVVHQERREEPDREDQQEHQLVDAPGPSEDHLPQVVQITASVQGLADDEHPQEEQHDVEVDGPHRLGQGDLQGHQDGHRAA